jgi:ribosomal protein S18 acetylase RimI-like enzyme
MDSPPVPLRRAGPADAAGLAEVAVAAYSGYLERLPEGVRPGPMDTDYAEAVARAEAWVAEFEGQIAGFLVLEAADDHLLLENVAVRPGFQGRGVGRRLLELAEERAETLGLPVIRLYTHAVMVENQRLYERYGYVETERRRDHGFDRVFFEKRLSRRAPA